MAPAVRDCGPRRPSCGIAARPPCVRRARRPLCEAACRGRAMAERWRGYGSRRLPCGTAASLPVRDCGLRRPSCGAAPRVVRDCGLRRPSCGTAGCGRAISGQPPAHRHHWAERGRRTRSSGCGPPIRRPPRAMPSRAPLVRVSLACRARPAGGTRCPAGRSRPASTVAPRSRWVVWGGDGFRSWKIRVRGIWDCPGVSPRSAAPDLAETANLMIWCGRSGRHAALIPDRLHPIKPTRRGIRGSRSKIGGTRFGNPARNVPDLMPWILPNPRPRAPDPTATFADGALSISVTRSGCGGGGACAGLRSRPCARRPGSSCRGRSGVRRAPPAATAGRRAASSPSRG